MVDLGCLVKLVYGDDFELEGILLGPDDAQIVNRDKKSDYEVISCMSPLGMAIRGKTVGETVSIKMPTPQSIKILSISKGEI